MVTPLATFLLVEHWWVEQTTPKPWTIRAAKSVVAPGAVPATSEARMKIARADRQTRRSPKRALDQAANGTTVATANR